MEGEPDKTRSRSTIPRVVAVRGTGRTELDYTREATKDETLFRKATKEVDAAVTKAKARKRIQATRPIPPDFAWFMEPA